MPTTNDHALWTRRFFWLLAGVVAFRLIYLFICIDFQIGGEEPYQWDWGRRPDWCYYSKPPMIAWLMALLRMAFGYHWWAFRLAALVLGTGSLAVIFLLGRRLYDARTGFFTALLFLCTPANAASNLIFSVDSPLVLCWTSALLLFWRAVEKPGSALRWLALTLVIGLGTLTKQMMLVFPLLMVAFAALVPAHRTLLRRPALWLTILGSLAFLTPVILWNAEHGGATLAHMKEHFVHEDLGFWGTVVQILRFPVLQAVLYSPISWGVIVAALWWCWRHWREAGASERFLFLFSAPALLVFQAMAFRQYINENWPAVYYVSAFVLGAGHALQQATLEPWLRRGWKLGASLLVIVHLYLPLIPVLGLVGHKKLDPVAQMRGWDESGARIGELLAKVPRPEQTIVIVLDHRNNASQMAFHLPQHPMVYRWNREGKVESQYEIWPNGGDKIGWDAFIIDPDSEDDGFTKRNLPSAIRHAFRSHHKLGDVEVPLGRYTKRSFQLFLCKDMRHWPKTEADDAAAEPLDKL